jgi:hypothetical protein
MQPRIFSVILVLLLASADLFAAPQSGAATSPSNSAQEVERVLRTRDQALLDAFAPGDTKTWEAALAPKAVYVDENGEVMSREKFLKQLTPLPAGASGNIKISSYQLELHGDVAVVIHTDDEEENYHGQLLHAQYLTTETWQKDPTNWRLLSVHTYAVLHDPPAVTLDAGQLDDYVGKYTAGDLVYLIQREGDHLVGNREGRPTVQLNVEVRDVLFVQGQPRSRKIFQRDSHGQVTAFSDRREGVDVVWKKFGSDTK